MPHPRPALAVVTLALALVLGALSTSAHASATTVSGRVLDASGRPLAGVLVSVLSFEAGASGPSLDGQAATDAAGRFSATTSGRPGRHVVRVCEASGRTCRRAADARLLKAYVGPAGVTSALIQQPDGFANDGGAHDVGDVTMQRPGSLSGTAPLARTVRLTDTAPIASGTAAPDLASTTVSGGRFRFTGLAPGLYRVVAGWSTRTVRVRPGATTQVALAERANAITGTVRVGGRPLKRGPLRIVPVDQAADPHAGRAVRTDFHGRYVVRRLPAGVTYAVLLGRSAGRVHDLPLVTRRVRVHSESSRHRLDLAVRPRHTGLAGSVRVEPIRGWSRLVNVRLWRGDTALGLVSLDRRGRYRLRGLTPGRYRVTAERRMIDDYERIRTDTTLVTVRQGQVTRVRRLNPHEGHAALTVRAPEGTELSGTDASGVRHLSEVVRAGAAGAVFRPLPPGTYTVRAWGTERLGASLTVRLGTTSRSVTARLGPVGGTTRGRLVTTAGGAAPLWSRGSLGDLRCVGATWCTQATNWTGAEGYEFRRLPAGRWDFQPGSWFRDELQPYHPVVVDRVTGRPGVTTHQDLRVVIRGG